MPNLCCDVLPQGGKAADGSGEPGICCERVSALSASVLQEEGVCSGGGGSVRYAVCLYSEETQLSTKRGAREVFPPPALCSSPKRGKDFRDRYLKCTTF